MFKQVTIIGLGLMGASLALALKKGRIAGKVVGFARRAETRRKARARKIVDLVCDRIADAVPGAEIVVVCAPVSTIPDLVRQCQPARPRKPVLPAVITDVGSVKERIVSQAEKIFTGKKSRFVGSHPLAGSEQRGLAAARADLYQGAVVAITPTPRTDPAAARKIKKFWKALGAEVIVVSPRWHDRIIARTSHLPHTIAALLAACVGRAAARRYGKFCGLGFQDTTRIAEGDPRLWRDILENNASFLRKELKVFARELSRLTEALKKGNGRQIEKCLERGRAGRRKLLAAPGAPFLPGRERVCAPPFLSRCAPGSAKALGRGESRSGRPLTSRGPP